MNTQSSGKALQIAQGLCRGHRPHDVDTIISASADDIVCTSPIEADQQGPKFREFHGGFAA